MFMLFNTEYAIVLTIPFKASGEGPSQVAAHALKQAANPIKGNCGDVATDCGIYVQVRHAPQD